MHGVGPVTVRKLYDLGIRTLEDARVYYGVGKGSDTLDDNGGESENYPVKVGLALAEELAVKCVFLFFLSFCACMRCIVG